MAHVTERDGYLLFWGGWPSNWYPSPFTLDGVAYNCVEQWMMACKARVFHDRESECKILDSRSPKEQKALGRAVKNFQENVWATCRYEMTLQGIIEKYRQNDGLRRLLLASGSLVPVEASPYDRVWGIGLSASHRDATKPDKWLGSNLLGKATAEARDVIRAHNVP